MEKEKLKTAIEKGTRYHNYVADAFKRHRDDNLDAIRFYVYGEWPVPTGKPNRLMDLNLAISKVIFNKPATIILWRNGNKTVVKCSEDDMFDPEKGLAMAICKELLGDQFKPIFKEYLSKEETIPERIKLEEKFKEWYEELQRF